MWEVSSVFWADTFYWSISAEIEVTDSQNRRISAKIDASVIVKNIDIKIFVWVDFLNYKFVSPNAY